MKIVVIGGSGLIGTKVVKRLREGGHDAVPASPATGVNTLTGEGLAAALVGAHVVVVVAPERRGSDGLGAQRGVEHRCQRTNAKNRHAEHH